MANPLLMLELSAMPASIKRTGLTQEVIRILRNTRPGLNQEGFRKLTGFHMHYSHPKQTFKRSECCRSCGDSFTG